MGYLPGKFARVQYAVSPSGTAPIAGPYRWAPGFRRERLDQTNFESAIGASGNNVFSEGQTGVMDTTFSVEMYMSPTNVNYFWPDASLILDLLFQKPTVNIAASLGYKGLLADVLDFSPSQEVRGQGKATANLQTNGLVTSAA